MEKKICEGGTRFENFANLVSITCGISEEISFLHDSKKYSVNFIGEFAEDLPDTARKQIFESEYLQPIAVELGVSLSKTSKLMAYKNAWIGLYQKRQIENLPYSQLVSKIMNQAIADYLVLTSNSWFTHPWIQNQINQSEDKEFNFPTNLTILRDDPNWGLYYQTWSEDKIHDIRYCIDIFLNEDDACNSWLEVSAREAEYDVIRANKKIEELNNQIKEQREVLAKAKEPINKLKEHNIKNKKTAPGRPSTQSARYDISKKFVAKWVESLMFNLSVSSIGELARVLGGDKMKCGQPTIWWRRLNKKTLASAESLEQLLEVKIDNGKHKGVRLCDVPTTPSLIDLIKLTELA
jgi:uncharacterized coiled-coil protein SlyX